MARKAGGKHPANVSAVIITQEEKQARLAAAPPGGGGVGGPGASVTTQYVPNVFEEQAQDMSDQLVGRAALITARKLGVPYVWSTTTKKKITLDSAETVCRKNPGLIYFDFDALEEIAAQVDQQKQELEEAEINLDGEEYVEGDEVVTAEEEVADLSDAEVMAELEESAELHIDPNKEIPEEDPLAPKRVQRRLSREEQIARVRQEALAETAQDPQVSAHTITETERRAWGGTFSTPGIQVYFHPNGITRVDVQGKVKLQTGIVGNVRTFRIQALERPTGGVVRNVTHKTVTGPQSPAQPPISETKQMQERIPIPVPPKVDLDEGTDY